MKKTTSVLVMIALFAATSGNAWADRNYRGRHHERNRVTVVNHYGGGGGYRHGDRRYYGEHRYHDRHHNDDGVAIAAGVAGLAVGAMVGSAVARNSSQNVVAVQQPVYGTTVYALPEGCVSSNYRGTVYYQCGGVYHQPVMGARGVYYQTVAPPF